MDPRQLLLRIARGVVYRRKVLVLSVFVPSLVVFGIAVYFLVAARSAPRFTTSASVLIAAAPDEVPLFREFIPQRPFHLQLAILKSRAIAETVLDSLPRTTIDELIENPYRTDYKLVVTNLLLRATGQPPIVHSPRAQALEELRRARLTFTSQWGGIVEIRADATRPQIALDLVNAYIQVLTERTRSFNTQDALLVREFLEHQIAEASKQLEASEQALLAYNRKRGVLSVPDEHQKVVSRLTWMEASLSDVQANKRIAETRLKAVRERLEQHRRAVVATGPEPAPLLEPSSADAAPQVPALRARLGQLEARLLEFQGRYTDEHPRVIQTTTQIAETRDMLQAALREATEARLLEPAQAAPGTKTGQPVAAVVPAAGPERTSLIRQHAELEEQLMALAAQEQALGGMIGTVKRTLGGVPTEQLEYGRLVGDVKSRQALHATLVDKLARARTREQSDMQSVKVLDPPNQPLPTLSSRSPLAFAAAFMFSLGVALAAAALVEYRRAPLETEDDVLATLNLTVLGFVPAVPRAIAARIAALFPLLKASRVELPDRRSAAIELEKQGDEELWLFSEAFHHVRTAIQIATLTRPIRSILVTSTQPGEGKTTAVFSLGHSFWEAGRRVILADADFYRPMLQQSLELTNDKGLTDLLKGKTDTHGALVPIADGLFVSGSGTAPLAERRGLLATASVGPVLEDMTREADVVIFDSSPLLVVPDNMLLASQVDAVILVVKAGETRMRDLMRAKHMLDRAGANVVGVIMNHTRRGWIRSYYRNHYRYYAARNGKG